MGSDVHPGFFESILQSSFHPHFYTRVMHQPSRRTVLYLLGLLAITSLLLGLRWSVQLSQVSGRILMEMEAKGMPTITVRDGLAEAEPPDPYRYRDSETGLQLLIHTGVEGEEAITLFKAESPDVMLTHRRLLIRVDETGRREYKLNALNRLVLDPPTRRTLRKLMIGLSVLLLPAAILLFEAANKILYVMLFSLVAWMVYGLRSQRLELRPTFQLGVYALTLPVLVDTGLALAGWEVPLLFTLLYVVLFFQGLRRAVTAAEEEEE